MFAASLEVSRWGPRIGNFKAERGGRNREGESRGQNIGVETLDITSMSEPRCPKLALESRNRKLETSHNLEREKQSLEVVASSGDVDAHRSSS